MVERVRLMDANGRFIRLISEREAHRLIFERKAEGLGTRRRIDAVQLTVERQQVEEHGVPTNNLLPNGLVGQRYSHDSATEENPAQVWMLRKLEAKSVSANVFIHECFVASVIDCLPEGERRAEFLAYLKSLHADRITGRIKSDLT